MHGCRRRRRQPARSSAPGRQGPPRPDRSGPAARHRPVRRSQPLRSAPPAERGGGRTAAAAAAGPPAGPGARAAAAAARSRLRTSPRAPPPRRPAARPARRAPSPAAQLAQPPEQRRPLPAPPVQDRERVVVEALRQQVERRRQVLAGHRGVRARAATCAAPTAATGNSGAPAGGHEVLELGRHLPRQQLRAAQRLLRERHLRPGPTPARAAPRARSAPRTASAASPAPTRSPRRARRPATAPAPAARTSDPG